MTANPRQKPYSCFDCKHYRPNDTVQFQGSCQKPAPRGTSNTGGGWPFSTYEFCQLPVPGIVWCGEFEKWTGTPRECGSCPAPPPQMMILANFDNDIASTKLAIESLQAGGIEGEEQEKQLEALEEKLVDLDIARDKAVKAAKKKGGK